MLDPVFASDGFTYERICIEQWFLRARTSPRTGEPLEDTRLLPNRMAKAQISDFLDERNRIFGALRPD